MNEALKKLPLLQHLQSTCTPSKVWDYSCQQLSSFVPLPADEPEGGVRVGEEDGEREREREREKSIVNSHSYQMLATIIIKIV